MKTVILGAGITGLTAGYDTEATIYESDATPGGLCKSIKINGCMVEESGGHWIFGMNSVIDKVFKELQIEYSTYKKITGVHFDTIIDGSIQDFANRSIEYRPGTMKEYLFQNFGRVLCNMFFSPFNKLYTNGLYERVQNECAYKNSSSGPSYNNEFIYPDNGLKFLIDSLSERINVKLDHQAYKIDTDNKRVYFSNRESVSYDTLISTVPLSNLLYMIDEYEPLECVTTFVVNIYGDIGDRLPSHHWLYTPFGGYYRVGFYTNVSKKFAPKGQCMAYVETTKDTYTPEMIMKDLERHGFIKKPKLGSVKNIKCAYTYRKQGQNIENIIKKLKEKDIHSIGRYGKWKFQGIVESMMDGLSAKKSLSL